MSDRPDVIWANALNLGGLWSKRPLRCKYDPEAGVWYDSKGDLCVKEIGLTDDGQGIIVFSSLSEIDVGLWTMGIKAAFKMLQRWAGGR